MNYTDFLEQLDIHIKKYNELHKEYICCKKGCSLCCETGDYPLSQIEFDYIMSGFIELDDRKKNIIQNNIKTMQKGKVCPFLHDSCCLIYKYRPVVCRIHGIAYKGTKNITVPYCAETGLNYSSVYRNNILYTEPIPLNLDTPALLRGVDYGEIRTMFEWLKTNQTRN